MARLNCKCGEELSNNEMPNNIQLWVYTDFEWDSLTSTDIIETMSISAPPRDVWRCTKCERLYFFENRDYRVAKIYTLEK